MIRLIKNWWLNCKRKKESKKAWLEWAKRTDMSLVKKFAKTFPEGLELKRYQEKVDNNLIYKGQKLKFTKPRSIKDLKEKNNE